MLKKYARLLFPEIRIIFTGKRVEAFVNREKVFFDCNCDTADMHQLQAMFLMELTRVKDTYLKYCLIKPKLVIKFTGASGDHVVLKEALVRALRKFDHLLAVFVDGNKKMIL
jgi:hypothetical protein